METYLDQTIAFTTKYVNAILAVFAAVFHEIEHLYICVINVSTLAVATTMAHAVQTSLIFLGASFESAVYIKIK